jgi:hypothetical protein
VYSKDREKIQAIATSWQQNTDWTMIAIEYPTGPSELGLARAERIRGYFVRYGVPAHLVTTVARADIDPTARSVGLSIDVCSRSASCSRMR